MPMAGEAATEELWQINAIKTMTKEIRYCQAKQVRYP